LKKPRQPPNAPELRGRILSAPETPPPLGTVFIGDPTRVTVNLAEVEDEAGTVDLLRTILWAQAQEIARQEKERENDPA
jgi:hypothetical protein